MVHNIEVKRGGEIKLQKGFIDLRDNGIKKNIILRKKARLEQRIQNVVKWFKLVGISLGVILIVSHNFNFNFDIANSFDNQDYTEQEVEKQMDNIINEVIQPEENIKDYKEEFQEDIKQEILEKKKEIQKEEIKKVESKKSLLSNNEKAKEYEEQVRIKEEEIRMYDEENKRIELEKKKEIQRKEIEKATIGKNPTVDKKEIVEVKKDNVDLNKLAFAVSMAETSGFTKGYGKTHLNGQGIKHGNTAPCPGVPKMAMCKFKTKEESNEAFKKIWSTWYKTMPNLEMAERWTGGDSAQDWLNIVNHYYYNDSFDKI